eukprot:TRINITY_DN1747_c0_g1_i2.p1 TRINITY_DN1747_c0_g1~~TRINITY_DN1747_c0_g1_i2.p1  ORF type:complete len:389 (+),score=64.34 TRINITY_DN1747_c0_g1_i2:60-1226(+)
MRRSGVARFRRPSNVILLVGVLLSLTFFIFCYFTMRSAQEHHQQYPDDFDNDGVSKRQRRDFIRERPPRYRQQPDRTLAEVEKEQREAMAEYKREYLKKKGGQNNRDISAEEESPHNEEDPAPPSKKKDQHDLPPISPIPAKQANAGLRIAIISAHKGEKYNYMAKLSGETKKKYAAMHGYTFIEDNDLIPEESTWNQRSAIRTRCFMKHMNDFDYMFWTDVDIFFTNPEVTIEEIIQAGRGAHVICSKDWGNRQLNPGSMIVKSSEFTRKFIIEWEDAIERVVDDLRAFQEVMKEHPEYETRKIRFISQAILNPYHHVETKGNEIVPKPFPDPDGHELWTDKVLLVHIVNCLRTSRNDCHLLANHFYRIAEKKFAAVGYPLEDYVKE